MADMRILSQVVFFLPTFYQEFQSGSERSKATQAMKNQITSCESAIAAAGSAEQKAKVAHDYIVKSGV